MAKKKDIEINVSTTNANMTTILDVEVSKWIELRNNLWVKYYNDTKLNKLSFPLLFNLWRDILGKDIVHAQYIFSTSTPIAIIYARLFGKPVVISPRGALCTWCLSQGSGYKSLWLKTLIKPYLKNIYWHATAEQEKNEILNIFPLAKVNVIPNGIEYEKFQNTNILTISEYTKKYIGQEITTSKIVVSMGRLQKKKGFDILIDAFKLLVKTRKDVVLLIAGQDEGEKLNLLKQIKKLNLEHKIFLVGNIEGQDKIDFFSNADVFALSSHNENFGNVYIESLASGTPIVASKGTPWSEVEDFKCGRWVENNSQETSNAILDLINKDRSNMQKNAKKLAKKYDWSIIADKFKAYYTSVL